MLSTGLLDIVLTGGLLTEAPIDLETSNWFQRHILWNTNLEHLLFPFSDAYRAGLLHCQ